MNTRNARVGSGIEFPRNTSWTVLVEQSAYTYVYVCSTHLTGQVHPRGSQPRNEGLKSSFSSCLNITRVVESIMPRVAYAFPSLFCSRASHGASYTQAPYYENDGITASLSVH